MSYIGFNEPCPPWLTSEALSYDFVRKIATKIQENVRKMLGAGGSLNMPGDWHGP